MNAISRSKVTPAAAAVVALALLAPAVILACTSSDDADSPDIVLLGFDGMDHTLTSRLIEEGMLPNFARLAAQGNFHPLGTAVPPQSPVAWSDFITGLDSGGHGIFDFVHRDNDSELPFGEPYLSTSRVLPQGRALHLGDWVVPLTGGGVELLRRGEAFWEYLERAGVETTIIRIPANFPPSGTATRELSGMGTPDLTGSPGEFTFFSTDRRQFLKTDIAGGKIHPAEVVDDVFVGYLEGPPNPFRAVEEGERVESVRTGVTVYLDPAADAARIVIGDTDVLLSVGEWSDWVPVEFELVPWIYTLSGTARLYLKSVSPDFEMYVSPLQIDPLAPAMPISTPDDFSAHLAEISGRYYTQGMPEDTKTLETGIFDREQFLSQATVSGRELIEQYHEVLAEFDGGFLFYYFGNLDQVSHMMWKVMDPEHPAYDPDADAPFEDVVIDRYVEMDGVLGYTLDRVGDNTLVVAMSDHGFTSWRRAFHLNAWLVDHGYLVLRGGAQRSRSGTFSGVDWTRTRAYALGINGLYLNLQEREARGVVDPAERDELLLRLERELLATVDPETGDPAITRVYLRERDYHDRGNLEIGPDVVVGYAKGVRQAQDTALGGIADVVIEDNLEAWSGDHLMDHTAVPGILVSSRPMRVRAESLKDLAAALLAEYGIEGFPNRRQFEDND